MGKELWNKLSKPAKIVAVELSRYVDTGSVSLNDLRLSSNLREFDSSHVLRTWIELASRGFGTIDSDNKSNPKFNIDRKSMLELINVPENQIPKST